MDYLRCDKPGLRAGFIRSGAPHPWSERILHFRIQGVFPDESGRWTWFVATQAIQSPFPACPRAARTLVSAGPPRHTRGMDARVRRIRIALAAAAVILFVSAMSPIWPHWRARDGGGTRDRELVSLWAAASPVVCEAAEDRHYYHELGVRVFILIAVVG